MEIMEMGDNIMDLGLRLSLTLNCYRSSVKESTTTASPHSSQLNLRCSSPSMILQRRTSNSRDCVVAAGDAVIDYPKSAFGSECQLTTEGRQSRMKRSRTALNLTGVTGVNQSSIVIAELDDEARAPSPPNSALSGVTGKFRDRDHHISDEDNTIITGGGRRKLRLTKEQTIVLEHTFRQHTTLHTKQKEALAKQLRLRPRQVEVWFQNRRARTKLKQTEVDCEYLKRCYEKLTGENIRLQKEVQELRALKLSRESYTHMNPPTTLAICSSCERMTVPCASSTSLAAVVVKSETGFLNRPGTLMKEQKAATAIQYRNMLTL
ncbi:Homeobox-leucine zipper protein HAT3-like protein [Drosera capensis]